MSDVQPVRTPVRVRESSSRTLDERLLLRFPGLIAASARLVRMLPPRSRVRRALLSRSIRMGVEAYNRRDLDVVVLGYDPALEYYPYREFVEAGLTEACYRGPAGYRRYIESTNDVWGSEVRLHPIEFIDLGDRVVLLANMPMRAQASGISLAETYAGVSTLGRDGRIVRQEDYLNPAEALAVVGISEKT